MAVTIIVQGQIQWRAARSPSQRWVGICDAMNLAMEANSLDELHSLINETMHLLLTDLLRDNELERYLTERGWRARGMRTSQKVRDVEFDVPWELIAEGARGSERRAN